MANKFEVQVVALDKFSKVFRDLNNSANKSIRPVLNMQRQTAQLFREMHIPAITKGFVGAARAAEKLAGGLGSIGAPLQGIVGLGTAGGVVAAIAGIASLTVSWAKAGFQVTQTATAIGASTDDLQAWRYAAKQSGISTEQADNALHNLQMTLHNAKWGDADAAMAVAKLQDILGRPLRTDSVAHELQDFARAFHSIDDPQTRERFASAFGLADMLPVLIKGDEALIKLAADARETGNVMGGEALENAKKMAEAMNRLSTASEGFRNNVLGAMAGPEIRAADLLEKSTRNKGVWGTLAAPFQEFFSGRLSNAAVPDFWNYGASGHWGALQAPGILGSAPSATGPLDLGNLSPQDAAQMPNIMSDPGLKGVVHINVNVANAPAGTTVTAKSSGGAPPVRVERSLDAGGASGSRW